LLLKPPALRPGDTIGVAAISSPPDPERLEAGIASLRARGYGVREAANLRSVHGFLAGTDAERAAGYRALLRDPDVAAIFFARGGYGAGRILHLLDPTEAREHPKAHLGGSDLTALFAYLWRHAGLVTFYGPMVAVEMVSGGALDWETILRGGLPDPEEFPAESVLAHGRAEASLRGGCLSILASLAGTPHALAADGSVLFWEDVGEEPYRLDRMLTQLEASGTFDRLQGMVIGSIAPREGDRAEPQAALQAWLVRMFREAPFPVVRGLPAGHLPSPRTIPLGPRVRLQAEHGASLEFLEAGVSSP
jgi:muramoyltetrapeptide carboxypeptidase